jgi:hypothetical protein
LNRDIKAGLSSLTAYGEASAAMYASSKQRLARITLEAHSSPAVQSPYNRISDIVSDHVVDNELLFVSDMR